MSDSETPTDAASLIESADAVYALLSTVMRRAPRDRSLTSLATLSTIVRTGPRRITDLAVIEGISQPSVTVLVTALERDGLVERHNDPTDKRVALVAATPAGRDFIRNRRQASTASVARLIEKLSSDEAAALAAAIPALVHLRDLDDDEREPASRTIDTS
jgi:DNA-binding MarR family transcriptional regulator